MSKNISIIIPTLNEEDNIETLVKRIIGTFLSNSLDGEIIFIDDNSTDKTRRIIAKLKKQYHGIFLIKLFLKRGKPGKAYSIIEGFQYVENKIVAMIDADLQYPPEAIAEMARKIEQGADIVVANRVEKETNFLRSFLSRSFNFVFAKILHDLNCDVQSGLKVFKRKIIYDVKLNPSPWTFDMEFLLSARNYGYKIDSVNIRFDERVAGRSKINIIKAVTEIGWNAIVLKTRGCAPLLVEAESDLHMKGAGVKHRKKHFITHTTLHHKHSALDTFVLWQKIFIFSLVLIFIVGLIFDPLLTGIIFLATISVLYFVDAIFSLVLVLRSLINPPEIISTTAELLGIDDKTLPTYSIFCPLYRESQVLPHFVGAIEKMEWPKDKLEVLLLLEENDQETIDVARSMNLPEFVKIIVVPHSFPKTKPKACNYGICFARGEFIVIYDAEDIPDPWQLKKAYLGFKKSKSSVLCLQAKLNYFNPNQNILTRLFTAEYSLWFDISLPGLQSINTSIPLGGTSNHFRTKDLIDLKGWDPFNVTEDCDLGIRLFMRGFKTAIIDSVTLEEANSNFKNWLRQRSRWIKGYMQTYLVHMRNPLNFLRQNGIHAFIFQLVVGGKIASMIINPLLWVTTIAYFTLNQYVGDIINSLFPTWIFYIAVVSLVFGNFLFIFYYMIGCAKRGHTQIIKYVFFIPFYWVMASMAAAIAAYQLFVKPHYWEKTHHGLHLIPAKNRGKIKKIFNKWVLGNYVYKEIINIKRKLQLFKNIKKIFIFSFGKIKLFAILADEFARKNGKKIKEFKFKKELFSFDYLLEKLKFVNFNKINNKIEKKINLINNKHVKFIFKNLFRFTFSNKGVILSAIMISNFINFIFNAFLTRKLSYSDLAIVIFITTIWYVVTVFIGGVSATINHKISYLTAQKKYGTAKSFLKRTLLRGSLVVVFLVVILTILSPILSKFFKIDSFWILLLFSPAILLGFLASSFSGFLKGNLLFGLSALIIITESVTKLFFAILFVILGKGDLVYLSVPLSLLAAFLVGGVIIYNLLKDIKGEEVSKENYFPFNFFFSSILATLSYIVFLSVDVILVKHFFSEEIAGQYSIISLAGKMVYFLATLPLIFLITFVSRKEGLGESSRKVFQMTFLSVLILVSVGVFIFGFWGFFTVPFLFGQKALSIVYLLPIYCLAVGIFALSNTIVTYHLAKKQYLFTYVSVGASLVLINLIWFFHNNDIGEVARLFLIVSWIDFAVLGIFHHLENHLSSLRRSWRDFLGIFINELPKTKPEIRTAKRILIFNWRDITHSFAGGAEIYIHQLAKNWIKAGNHVTIFCGNDGKQLRTETIDDINIVRRGGFYMVYFWAFLYYIFRFRGKYDLVIDCENGIPFFTPLYVRKPIFAVLHHVHQNIFFHSLPRPLALIASFLEKDLMPLVYRKIKFITVSQSSKIEMEKLGIGKSGIEIIHNGVDLKQFILGDKSIYPMVLYLGRLRAYKSVDVLIRAFKRVIGKYNEAILVIAGRGDAEKYLKELSDNLGFKKNQIIFKGKVTEKEKIKLLQSAWVLVNPSFMEGWGVVVIEANACGTPVIASNVKGLCDSVRNNESGYLVPYGDIDCFADKIIYVLENSEYRHRLNLEARKWAENFNWENSSKKFLSFIDSDLAKENLLNKE